MEIYCLENFKTEFEKLKSKNSYNSIEKEVIKYFFNKDSVDLNSGIRLNGNSKDPYIKKRICGRGGFRVYFLIIIKNDCLYLMHVHPKAGTLGYDNINDDFKTSIYKDVLEAIKSKNLFELTLDRTSKKILFKKVIVEKTVP